jgi:hypothetical protein
MAFLQLISKPLEDPAFEVHHQGHQNGLNGHLGQAPVADPAQTVTLFALGELALDLGASPSRQPGI